MSNRYVQVVGGIVANIIVSAATFSYGDGSTIVASDTAQIGWSYDGTNFTAASPATNSNFTTLNASTTITAPGRYKLATAGITISLPFDVGGDVILKEATGSATPNITLVGTFDGQSGMTVEFPNVWHTFVWDSAALTYLVF